MVHAQLQMAVFNFYLFDFGVVICVGILLNLVNKIQILGVLPGGMVTARIDPCIILYVLSN